MKKLTFYYGSMMSGKTTALLCAAKCMELRQKKYLIFKPRIENAPLDWCLYAQTRGGDKKYVDYMILKDIDFTPFILNNPSKILVDEAQFLSQYNVECLRELTAKGISIDCYGLKTNYRGHLFEGSKSLLELSDEIHEIKTDCWECSNPATMVYRVRGGHEEVEIEEIGEQNYLPLCYDCWSKRQVCSRSAQ